MLNKIGIKIVKATFNSASELWKNLPISLNESRGKRAFSKVLRPSSFEVQKFILFNDKDTFSLFLSAPMFFVF